MMNNLESDSIADHDILKHGVRMVKDVLGLTCEIGLRCGGGSEYIIQALLETNQTRTHVSIDPFGGLPYYEQEDKLRTHQPYPNVMKKKTLKLMYEWLIDQPSIDFVFFPLEDTEFFKRFGDGVPIYKDAKKTLVNEYAFVYFDGPHTVKDTLDETKFFMERASMGAVFCYDDVVGYYDHNTIRQYLGENGWAARNDSPKKNLYLKVA